ncbi:peptide ABC transporter substrate-binding protein [Dolosicoccus paucivorans]
MRQLIRKIMLVVASFLLVATSSLSVFAQDVQELNISIGTEPPTISPTLGTDTTSGAILSNVFEGLTEVGTEEPAGAESWEVSEDGRVYTFKLRQDAKWSNGEPVTAHDYEYAWKAMVNPDSAAGNAAMFYIIEGAKDYNEGQADEDAVGVKALDDYTFEVTLVNPTPYFISLTGHYNFFPVNKQIASEDPNWASDLTDNYVSNGPFVLTTWNHNSDLVLEKNGQYWDKDNVALDVVNIDIIDSAGTANVAFQNGSLDYIGNPFNSISLEAIDIYKDQDILQTSDYIADYWYILNTEDEVMSNVNIRKALALAIDRQGLVDNVTKGGQTPAFGLVPPFVEGFSDRNNYFEDADYDQAKEYLEKGLEELGMNDPSELNLQISINTDEGHAAIAQYIQDEWNKHLGVQSQIDNTEWQVFLDKMEQKDYQIGRLGWTGKYNDGNTFLDIYTSKDHGINYTGWEDEEYTRLMEEASKEVDEEKRLELMKEAEAIFIDQMPVIPINYYSNTYVAQDHVKNMKPDLQGRILLKHVSVEQ